MANNALLDRIKKNSTIKETAVLATSTFFDATDNVRTSIPAINIALSGSIDGGFGSGLFIWAGPSKHFKTMFTLLMLKSYLDKYPDAIGLFYDSEFGTPQAYFDSVGIDMTRVVHTPVTTIEELKFDIMKQLEEIKRGDKVFIALDSAGNIASKKEVDDALDGKSVADMTRAKQLKSLFRMVTPHLTLKQLPMVVVNHTYMTQEMFSKAVVSGGTGIYYSASAIFILGRQQEKDGSDLLGYNFIINVEKSRMVREKSKIPVQVLHGTGMNKYSALMDIALESKHVVKPKNGWYCKCNPETGELDTKNWRMADTNTDAFWASILGDPTFDAFVKTKYEVSSGSMFAEEQAALTEELAE